MTSGAAMYELSQLQMLARTSPGERSSLLPSDFTRERWALQVREASVIAWGGDPDEAHLGESLYHTVYLPAWRLRLR